jgi:hypothetical protein
MADFGLIGRFHRLALAAVIVAAMPVYLRIFQPDLTDQHFANAL